MWIVVEKEMGDYTTPGYTGPFATEQAAVAYARRVVREAYYMEAQVAQLSPPRPEPEPDEDETADATA